MKKKHFVFICLSFLGLSGMLVSAARAQGTETPESYPVSLYGLTAAEAAPEHPADGWTEFQMPVLGESGRDTLTKTYLRTDAAPLDITNKTDVALNAIGFDFPYGGRTMTHFGVTGNGLIYLGAAADAAEPAETAGEVKRSLAYVSIPMSLEDAIAAFPQCDNRNNKPSYTVHNMADAETKIGYQQGGEADARYLVISFRNVLASFVGLDNKDYAIHLTYDVMLHEDGRIMCRFADLSLSADEQKQLKFAYGLFGQTGEQAICASDWKGGLKRQASSGPFARMPMTAETATAVLTYTLPQPCAAPQGVPVTGGTPGDLYSTDFSRMTLQIGTGCDGWLVLVSDEEAMTERPVDGRVYKSGGLTPDSIGGFPVRLVSSTSKILSNVKGLQSNTTYYIYVYPYNEICIGGPAYQREPVKIPVTTIIGGPAVETAEVTETSATFNFPELAADAEILVGMARRDYRKDATRYILDGISGKAYAKGDTLFYDPSTKASSNGEHGPYFIEAVHAGKVADGALTISGLEPATPYYFYFWTALEGENQYSKEYVETSVLTVPTTPYTFTFATDRVPKSTETILPAGWSRSTEGMNIKTPFSAGQWRVSGELSSGDEDADRRLAVQLIAVEKDLPTMANIITPAFRSSHPDFDVRYRVRLQTSGNETTLIQPGEGDTLTVWYRTAGQAEWTLVSTVTNEEPWVYGEDRFATLKATVRNVPQDKDIQLRFMIRAPYAGAGASGRTFVLHHVLVEPHLSCAYPENLAVSDSLTTHWTLGLSWQDENTPASSVIYRYRETETEVWSSWKVAQEPTACAIRPLQAHTAYEVALQAVCRSGDSSLVKTITAATWHGLPYTQVLTDLPDAKTWPAGIEAGTGTLPAEEAAQIVKDVNAAGWKAAQYSEEGHTAAGLSFGIASPSERWLQMPVLCLEDMAAPAEFTFQYKAYYRQDNNAAPEAVNPESKFRVLVLVSEDGSFSRADSVGELRAQDLKLDYQTYTIDLSAYTRQVHIALYAENPPYRETYDPKESRSYFIVDSLAARYTGDRPCYTVEDIDQYGLKTTGITLSWTGYSVEYGIILTNEDKGVTDTVYTTETTYTFSDLEPGTLYTYRIQAYCEDGHRSPSALSEEGFFTTRNICGVPTDFAVLGTTWQSVTLTSASSAPKLVRIWGKDEQYAHLEYLIERPAGIDTVTLKGLAEELHVTYYVAVRSICSPGDSSAWTEPLEFTTDIPECGAPTNLKCGAVGTDYAELSWTAGKHNDYFNLMYRPSAAKAFDTVPVEETAYRLADLKPETAYVWQLQAVCDEYLVSAVVKGADFTTEGVAVELTSRFQGLKVGSDHGRIAVWNADALPIDRVEVYALTGRMLYGQDFRTTDHLLLPSLGEGSRMLLVRIFSAGETAVYKIVL